MEAFISLFSQYNVPAAFLVNIELTLWSALFSTILGVILVMMRISPVAEAQLLRHVRHQLLLACRHRFEPVYGGLRVRIAAIRHQHRAAWPG